MSPRKPQALKKQQFFYAVGVGRSPGVYSSWGEIAPLVKDIRNAKFRKFPTYAQAKEFVAEYARPLTQSPGETNTPPRTPVTPVTRISSDTNFNQWTQVTPSTPVRNFNQQQALDNLREKSRLVSSQIAEAPSNHLNSESSNNSHYSLVNVKSEILSQTQPVNVKSEILSQTQPVNVKSEILSQASTSSQPSNYTSSSQQMMNQTKISDFERRLRCLEESLQQIVTEKTNEIKKLKEELHIFKSQVLATSGENGSADLSSTLLRLNEKRAGEEAKHPTKRTKLIDIKQEPAAGPSSDNGSQQKINFTFDKDGYCIVYTDGACINNGQSGARAGIGVWFGVNHPLNVADPLEGDCSATNNNAEIQAATSAVTIAKYAGLSKVCIYTDSEFTINCATKWMKNWKRNGWRKADGKDVINRQQLELLDENLDEMDVKWVHVRGHSKILGNEMADKLANEGAAKYGRVISI